MNLNGQCEKAFNEFLNKLRKHPTDRKFADIDLTLHHQGYEFEDLPHEMQHGVKVKFFDSVGIYLETAWIPEMGGFGILINSLLTDDKEIRPRTEAQHKAEQKANDIYNENN